MKAKHSPNKKSLLVMRFTENGIEREWHEPIHGRPISEVLSEVKEDVKRIYPHHEILGWVVR